jgi:selenium metabolism protein YedF
MKIVDTTGLTCPEPLILTKRALKEVTAGEKITVITDNSTSLANLKRFLTDNGSVFSVTSDKGVYTLIVERGEGMLSSTTAAEYCEVSVKSDKGETNSYSIIFSSEKMGEGNDDLGLILIRSFITTLIESDSLPESILFYNAGVKLATDDSFVIEELKKIESMGVKLLLCGTCVNFFNLKQSINIGIISNMYEMSDAMISSAKIIKP